MRTLSKQRIGNLVHATLILTAMSLLLGLLGWSVAGTLGLIWALSLGTVVLVFSSKLSTAAMLRFYGAVPLLGHQFAALHSAIDVLADRAELPVKPALFYLPSRIPNAFAIGSKSDPAVVVTDGLLRTLNLRETVGVIAHEISHIRHNDLGLLKMADIMSRLTSWFSIIGQLFLFINLPLLLLGENPIPWLAIILLIISPAVSKLLELALSRNREIDADLDGVAMSGDPLALASALNKMRIEDRSILRKAVGRVKNPGEPSLWRTHPHTKERIERILSAMPTYKISSKPSHLNSINRTSQWCHDTGC
jgi:heat shock protein HtpX